MPVLEEALFTYLSADPAVYALVEERIYPFRLPEGCLLPAIAWQRISSSRTYTHDPFEDTSAFVRARIQFSCWAIAPLQAIQIGEAVLLALSGYTGDMAGQLIGASSAELELDEYEQQTKLYRRVLDFFISYEDEPKPTS